MNILPTRSAIAAATVVTCLCIPSGSSAQQTNRIGIEARAMKYWQTRADKDLAQAYTFYCPMYRTRVSQPSFIQQTRLIRFDLRNVRVARVDQETDTRAVVHIRFRYLVPTLSPEPLDGEASDVWIKDASGEWCKEDEPLVLPFPPPAPPK
jgi:hypothetical protein